MCSDIIWPSGDRPVHVHNKCSHVSKNNNIKYCVISDFVSLYSLSSQPKESTSITYVESINDKSHSGESTSSIYVESISDNSQPKESTSITFVESINDKPNTEELTYENYEEAPSTMTSIYEYGSLHVDGATSEVTAQSDLKTSPSERISVSTPLSQSTVISVDEDVDETSKMKNTTRLIVSAFAFRVFGILLIFVDIFLIMSDVIFNDNKIVFECHSISLAIALFFFFDVLLRVYVEGRKTYFTDLFNILDAVIIAITLLIDTIYFFFDLRFLKDVPRVAVLLRPLRLIILVRVFHLAYQNRQLQKLTRRLVSENKRRYRRDGFDLDLTYITDRIIAMSFPSSGKQSFYRNPIKEVVRFLDTKHRNHYRVYNLCSERAYNPEHFHNRVQRIMIDDHNVPTLSEMVVFSKEVNMWLAQDKKNVVVIHCKGGKGRTGTMVCACLIGNQIFGTAKESLAYFASRRTDHTISSKFQGIETPSQVSFLFKGALLWGEWVKISPTHGFTLDSSLLDIRQWPLGALQQALTPPQDQNLYLSRCPCLRSSGSSLEHLIFVVVYRVQQLITFL
ncbi:phosphatidylinositol 3,4,5-trisphosphate 3-phosphatase TPTE2-like isoform X2 [Oryctolagus cuniculus]|uniref:phosphatidylinositol 3,4,5-trisphosphate 3-phosphatase TPTE2-like isoform X2 n=1 Tax=Oryctolagus cuniculus TaxID=9986 RepID=UPI00387A5944